MDPILTPDRPADPEMERAMFFMDLELAELTAVIPPAQPPEPKFVY
ncbi:MAG: hypothetical protein JWM80_1469 [Cyanobacteria bacterium RYN_339]|nr:hypothetical protein [Cyanobacteria bacterium RYN_339]